ncbi:MAG: RnfABCDGE type electron transport complex subunit G [bacterium]|nr:RnfABCDGE type electron transport complex subunit G [bacterium]
MIKDVLKLVFALTLVCVIAALALVYAYNTTKDAIAEQDRLAKLEAIKAVLPPYDNEPDRSIKEKNGGMVTMDEKEYYIAKKEGIITGVAFQESTKNGYGGLIEVMIGVSPKGSLNGIDIVKHLETPGLGNKIDTPQEDNTFKNQFKDKSLANSKLINGELKVKKDGGDIQAISGATISPRAVCEAVSKGLKHFEIIKEKLFSIESSE